MSTGAFFCGCASYITPGGRADFAHFSHPSIAESFAVKPAASIPAAVDTRTGFIYAAFEATERRDVDASLWSERQKADLARQEAEAAAFRRLMDEFESNWHLIVDRAGEGA